MKADLHERARLLIALAGSEEVCTTEQSWLASHLESCAICREFAENSRKTVRSLRATPITAGASLVSTTQLRVRQRAQELQRQQERLWVTLVCCAAVTLCTALTTAALWRGFAWICLQVGLVAPVWEACFVVFCLMPAILAGILLLARGTYLVDHNTSYQE
jgi:uncharacterized membrane protein